MKKYLLHTVYVVALALTLLSVAQLLLYVIGDIMAGALSGRPETGWGFLIATFLSPIPALFGVIAYYSGKKLKLQQSKLGKSSILVVLLAVVIAVSYLMISASEQKSFEAELQAAKAEQTKQNAPIDITRAEATTLLSECKPKLFLYGAIRDEAAKEVLAHSKEGVVLESHMGEPLSVSVSDSAKDELLPLAQQAEEKCEYFEIHELKP